MINHHPGPEFLLDYATGTLSEGPAVVIAAHAAMCGDCRAAIGALEGVGGLLLAEAEPVAMAGSALDAVLARLDEPERVAAPPAVDAETAALVPAPLRRYVGPGLGALFWRRLGRAIDEARLPIPGVKATLMRIRAGSAVPRHGHRGLEYTLVLAGGFRDESGAFGPGDIAVRDASHEHQPVVDDDEDCLCLAIIDAPLKLSGMLGWFVNPFLRA
jgi:putative transcriptional regulator